MSFLKTIVLGTLLTVPMVSGAATYTIAAPVTTSAAFSTPSTLTGAFTDTWNFTIAPNSQVVALITNVTIGSAANLNPFTGTIDGSPLTFSSASGSFSTPFGNIPYVTQILVGAGTGVPHQLVISGTGTAGSYSGTLSVKPVPVPAAAWLMGSALVGLVSFGRRKVSLTA